MEIHRKIGSFFHSKFFLVFSVLCFLYIQGTQSDHFFKWVNPDRIVPERSLTIITDGAGYYAYLPNWFIYKDNYQSLEKITTKYNTPFFISGVRYDYVKHSGVNKYYIGTAVCSMPAFLINHSINKILYDEADGYSRSYQFTVAINALIYWLLGVIALIFLLQKWKVNNFWIVLSIGILTFGTNLNFYTVYFPSFSHVFSFAAISWFIYLAVLWAENKKTKNFIFLCLLLGLIFLIRPTNVLILFIVPFFFLNWKEFIVTVKSYLFEKKKFIVLGVFLFGLCLLLQLISVHSQIGEYKLNTYGDEKFDFLFDPQIFNVLLSYRKGFFIYAPVMFLSPFALIWMFKVDRFKAIGITLVSFLFVYLTSSWWCWWYGGGLGMRPFIDILTLLVIPIALLLKYGNAFVKTGILLSSFLGIWIYQIYQIQYHLNIIVYDGMTKESFWNVFMKTDMRYAWSAFSVDEKLPEKKSTQERIFYLLETSKIFTEAKNGSRIVIFKKMEEANPGMTFVPDSTWGNSKIGIISRGLISISQGKSNPYVEVIYFKNDSIVKEFRSHIGYKIQKLHSFTPYHIEFNPGLKYYQVDSIRINIGKSEVPTKMKDIEIQFYRYSPEK